MNKEKKQNPAVGYLQDSVQELKKVTWPTRNQSIKMTFLVLGFCVVAAVVIGLIDFAFYKGHEKLIQMAPPAAVSAGEETVLPGQVSDSKTATPAAITSVITPENNKAITIQPGTQATQPKN